MDKTYTSHHNTVIGTYIRQARTKSSLEAGEAVMLQGIDLNSNQGKEMKEGFGPGGEKILFRAGYSIITHLNFIPSEMHLVLANIRDRRGGSLV